MASLLSLSLPKPNIIKASSSTAPATSEVLNDKFSRKGIKFSELGDNTTVVDLTVRNGSSLRLRIPEAHVSSYKPKVYWKDDGFEEVLYTTTLPSSPNLVKGGIGLVLNDASENSPKNGMSLLSGCEWTVQHVHSDSIDTLQVELGCTSGGLEIIYVVTLYHLNMATAVIVKNKGKKAVSLRSAMLNHFKFKKRHKSAIQGLKGCKYCSHPPLSSPFELLSPSEAVKPETSSAGLFTFGFSEPVHAPGVWAEQDVPFTILRDRISRVYATPPDERLKEFFNTPPSKYETLDQGRELFYRVIKLGFEDIYVSSPGSSSEKFGSEYFACTGPASMLVPVVIQPGESWRGAQMIEHDNL